MEPPYTFNETQAAKVLGICRNTLRKYVDQGILPAPKRLGKRKLYSRRLLQEWAERGEQIDHNSIAAIR